MLGENIGMPPRKLRTTGEPTPLQKRTLREHFGIAPRTRGVDYSALRVQYNTELTNRQREERNRKARERRNPVRAIVRGIMERVVENQKIIKAQKTLRNYFFKKGLAKRIEARANRRFLHTLNYDAYSTQQRENSRGNLVVYLKYEGPKSVQFQSKFRHPLRPFNYNEAEDLWLDYPHRNANPTVDRLVDITPYFDLDRVVLTALGQIGGSDGRVCAFTSIDILEIPREDVRLIYMPLYKVFIDTASSQFRGFVDSGNFECVPETILHHITRWENRKNKRYTLEQIKSLLDSEYDEPRPAGCGYTVIELTNCLRALRCAWKLVDVNEKVFSSNRENVDKNLPVFVAQVWNNHLYYCDDEEYIKSLASAEMIKTRSNKQVIVKKKEKPFQGIVLPVDDLKDIFLQQFTLDKKFRRVNLYNNRIVGYELDAPQQKRKKGEKKEKAKWIYANPDLELVKEVCGNLEIPFKNQSLTFLGKSIFEKLYPKHRSSHFNANVYSQLQVNTGIVEVFGATSKEQIEKPIEKQIGNTILNYYGTQQPIEKVIKKKKQSSVDINKCRTACLLDNRLGDYPVFGIADDIEPYDGLPLKLGWYYVETENRLPLRGSGWYSNQFLQYCSKEGIKFDIKYQLIASGKIPHNFSKQFVETVIKASPTNYKNLINTTIGYFGKTLGKYTEGYLETDFRYACQKFWDNENIGTVYDLEDAVDITNRKRMRVDKFKCVDIGILEYDGDEKIYLVQQTNAKKEYTNDLPIYNKVLENEWIRCYELSKQLGGKLIKIKTDNVIVEYATGSVEFSETIGGYKDETLKENWVAIETEYKEPKQEEPKQFITERVWNKTPVEKGDADNFFEKLKPKLPTTSFCLTGLAGYGKSECIKGCDWYNDEDTIKVAFTNKATESMAGETICRAFGIDFNTGLATQSKLSKCKDVKRIINDECFMTPSYAMKVFELIHQKYPEIQFIFVGDPHQTRPVGEEKINWLETSVFYELCGGNLVELIENQRNDLTKEYFDLIEGRQFDTQKFGNHKISKINICRTNERRRELNDYFMNKEGLFIEYNREKHNLYGQDVWVKENTPVMSVVNNLEKGLINSKMWVIEKVGEVLTIGGNEYTYEEFMRQFVVAYAFTNHKVQSITIKEPFCIHEWNKMTPRERYTAFSRTSKRQYVKIYE